MSRPLSDAQQITKLLGAVRRLATDSVPGPVRPTLAASILHDVADVIAARDRGLPDSVIEPLIALIGAIKEDITA